MTKGPVDEVVCAEGYGPEGTALLVVGPEAGDALRQSLRRVILRHGGRVGAGNSVAYLFHTVGVLRYPGSLALATRALDAGAEDWRELANGDVEVLTDPAELASVREALARHGHQTRAESVTRRAARRVKLNAPQYERLVALVGELRALDGVGQVYTNAEMPEPHLDAGA